ncbi:hypothetical protein BGZ63DRAFT_404664 [Mariannaea sp. PMI_226]|nr:hypothetical protein BGZ63DRAFT_404664 [Mariannaea sp. PMI_226]
MGFRRTRRFPSSAGLTCHNNDKPQFPIQFPSIVDLGVDYTNNKDNSRTHVTDILWDMRAIVCNGGCSDLGSPPWGFFAQSASSDGKCAIAVPLQNGYQAMVYRETNEDNQKQDCWDALEKIIQCSDDPNHIGWSNGPGQGQFYQAGIESMNSDLPGGLKFTNQFDSGKALFIPSPPDPKDTDGNHKGAGSCVAYDYLYSHDATQKYEDDYWYTNYTSYTVQNAAGFGMASIWQCNDDVAYARGMKGHQIKAAVSLIHDKHEGKKDGCGSVYLDNGCQVTVDYCYNCKHSWPPGQEK